MEYIKRLFSLKTGEENKNKVKEDVIKNISFRGAQLWILACAILIASIGLNINSTAVIIGAMLISPLMGPIVGSGFALATYDFQLLKRSAKNLLIASCVGLLVSALYFYLSPFKDVQSEILARISPTIYDVMIAFFGGIVGAISITRIEKGNPIPGVAIATALMPPLCTAGFGLATLNFKYLLGALYLYSINCFFIGIATLLVIKILKYRPVRTENLAFDKKVRVIISLLMVLMIVPSLYLAYSLLQEKRFIQNADDFIQKEFNEKGYTIIYKKINYKNHPKTIDLALLSKKLDSTELLQIRNSLSDFNLTGTEVNIKQNTKDLKKEILSEINQQSSQLTQKELQIQSLTDDLESYKIGDPQLDTEVKILFPGISQLAFGVVNNFSSKDSIQQEKLVLYSSQKPINEAQLKAWLIAKYPNSNIRIVKQ